MNERDPSANRIMDIIYAAIFFCPWLYFFICAYFIRPAQNIPEGSEQIYAVPFFVACGLFVVLMIVKARHKEVLFKLFYDRIAMQRMESSPTPGAGALPYMIILWTFDEAIAVIGCVAYFMGAPVAAVLATTLMSCVSLYASTPKKILEEIAARSKRAAGR